jgi:hypothetical protein
MYTALLLAVPVGEVTYDRGSGKKVEEVNSLLPCCRDRIFKASEQLNSVSCCLDRTYARALSATDCVFTRGTVRVDTVDVNVVSKYKYLFHL